MKLDPLRRFKSKLFIDTLFLHQNPNLDPCWLWRGKVNPDGYVSFRVDGITVVAHRWFYEQLNGKVNQFLELDHLCRIRHCMNPKHLEVVSSQENALRSSGFPAINAAKTHCPKGHEYTADNLYVYNGSRQCKTCTKARSLAAHYRKPHG